MNKKLTSERGITLPELLAVFVILGFLSIVIISFLINGFKQQARLQIEAELRDEADIIMAELISDIYTLKKSDLKEEHFPQSGTNNYYFELLDGEKVGFIDGEIQLKSGDSVSLTTNKIVLEKQSKIELIDEAKGLYRITLVLKKAGEGVGQTLTTESEVSIIMD